MSSKRCCDCLVVDSGGFIKCVPVEDFADEVVTLREVVEEIRDKSTRQRLQVTPYELKLKDPDPEDLKTGGNRPREDPAVKLLS